MAALPQGPWLDLLEIRADQAMEARDYAEVLSVADPHRRSGGEPGFKLQAQEIVVRAARRTSRVGRWWSMEGQGSPDI